MEDKNVAHFIALATLAVLKLRAGYEFEAGSAFEAATRYAWKIYDGEDSANAMFLLGGISAAVLEMRH